jgi:hypothetical protein
MKSTKHIVSAASAAALLGISAIVYAQGTPPDASVSNPAIGAGQQSNQGTPMGTTGVPADNSGTTMQNSTGTVDNSTVDTGTVRADRN